MPTTTTIELAPISRDLKLTEQQVTSTLELLDAGNTVPFITRYRKDQTGGLDEEQIRNIEDRANKARMLADRRQTIMRSIESQGKMTEPLAQQINEARSTKRLDDLYLPFKPKKQSLASVARQRGLEPLANEIYHAQASCIDLDKRAADFINEDKKVPTAADALLGAGHILAEQFSENADLRQQVRKIFYQSGVLQSSLIEVKVKNDEQATAKVATKNTDAEKIDTEKIDTEKIDTENVVEETAAEHQSSDEVVEVPTTKDAATEIAAEKSDGTEITETAEQNSAPVESSDTAQPTIVTTETESVQVEQVEVETVENDPTNDPPANETENTTQEISSQDDSTTKVTATKSDSTKTSAETQQAAQKTAKQLKQESISQIKAAKKKKKEKLKEKKVQAFSDYFDFKQSIKKIPHHRVLAVNRGERAKILRIKIDVDEDGINNCATELLVPKEHPHHDFMCGCVRDSLSRLVIPSLQREIRRELTDKAEQHAVHVFARNLSNLLLQSPVHEKRVLAIDPGFRSGCKLVALDEFGNLLDQGIVYVIGNASRKKSARKKIAEMIHLHQLNVIVIGNGTACRESEQMVAEMIAEYSVEPIAEAITEPAAKTTPSTTNSAATSEPSTAEANTADVVSAEKVEESEVPKTESTTAAENSTTDSTTGEITQPATDQPSNDQPSNDQPSNDQPSNDQPSNEQPSNEQPSDEQPSDEQPSQPVTEASQSNTTDAETSDSKITEAAESQSPTAEEKTANKGNVKETPKETIDPEALRQTIKQVAYVIVNEAGASVYSTSAIGREEFPQYDATLRGAISIGRRLQDPLSELVKIDPSNIGVGLYQHDVKAKHLRQSLDAVVESCVNFVGVDINTASPSLLRYVSGLNQLTARRLYEYRTEHGPFKSREALKSVPGFGEVAFIQAAGFLKITAGDNVLDSTWIHPESYDIAQKMLESISHTPRDLIDKEKAESLSLAIAKLAIPEQAETLNVGQHLLKDIAHQLSRPGRDPREDLPKPLFKKGILKLEDLVPAMELTGTVLNVVDFGAFIDIGLHDSGLVHVSQLSTRYTSDPHEIVSVGDVVKVWVMTIDKDRRRVSLTMLPPGVEREKPERRAPKPKTKTDDSSKKRTSRTEKSGSRQRQTGGRRDRYAGKKPQHRKEYRPKPKPKPKVPLTEAMKAGKEPLRTFGDLSQFFEKKDDNPPENEAT